MATPVTMPMLGLTMEEGTVAEWLKLEGDAVKKDEPLLTVEMDKGTVEVPAPASGVLRRIVVQPGTTVPVKAVIAEIGDPGEPSPAPSTGSPGVSVASEAPAGGIARRAADTSDLPSIDSGVGQRAALSGTVAPERKSGSSGPGTAGGARLFASPRARMRARALAVELNTVLGSGPQGRIVEADVLAASTSSSRVVATPLARRLAQEHGVAIADVAGTGPGGRITQDDVLRAAGRRPTVAPERREAADGAVRPMSRVRRITAERMAASAQATARVSLFLEADFSEAARFREQLQPEFARLGVPKLPWDAVIAKAAALALAEHPSVRAQWADGNRLRVAEAINVGIAVSLEPEGLVVPVLRDAANRSLRELAGDLLALVDKARAGRLSPQDMQGGTFSITNLGGYRIDGFTPIINPPETAILGVGRIADKAVVIDNRIEAHTMCTLSLSFDHRVVDGASAAAFLARLAELLERPYALLGI